MFLLLGGSFAHSEIDGCLLGWNRDLLNVLPPLGLKQLALFLFLHVVLFLL